MWWCWVAAIEKSKSDPYLTPPEYLQTNRRRRTAVCCSMAFLLEQLFHNSTSDSSLAISFRSGHEKLSKINLSSSCSVYSMKSWHQKNRSATFETVSKSLVPFVFTFNAILFKEGVMSRNMKLLVQAFVWRTIISNKAGLSANSTHSFNSRGSGHEKENLQSSRKTLTMGCRIISETDASCMRYGMMS